MGTLATAGILLVIAGLILVFIEMLLPGFGAPGISGGICLVIGIVLAAKTVEQGLTLAIVVIVVIAVMMTCVVLFFHKGKDKSPIKLQEKMAPVEDFLSTSDLSYLIGENGLTATDLRPAGKCEINGVTFDVRSEGSYIKKGSPVEIVKIQGNTLIVKESMKNDR